MSILIKHGDKYYEIPDDVLAKSGLTRDQFEKRVETLSGALAEHQAAQRDQCNFLDLSVCQIDE